MLLVGLNMPSGIRQTDANGSNLLTNGNFDELPFDWFSPNHYVAGGWYRWLIDSLVN
jgi:hypothetical protein